MSGASHQIDMYTPMKKKLSKIIDAIIIHYLGELERILSPSFEFAIQLRKMPKMVEIISMP